ncbi:DUF6377 domain-containing protein [Flagellimonas sp.]|uniref:DUF6377 domain-containing protein n=1 Tax=Flagellimonas sp. TaxID=2058762 RepID=UPI003AB906E3
MGKTTINKLLGSFLSLLISGMTISDLSAQERLDTLLNELDRTIHIVDKYTAIKEQRITQLKRRLGNRIDIDQRFLLYKEIFNEYEFFVCDSAYQYSQKTLSLAKKLSNIFWINESNLQISKTLTISGMYPESIKVLDSIDKSTLEEEQLIDYYTSYYHTFNEWGEFAEYSYSSKYKQLGSVYRDSLLSRLRPGTFEHTVEYGWKQVESGEYEKAKEMLLPYLDEVQQDTREYALITSIVGILYWYLGDMEKHKEYLAMSAISDIKATVKENTSIRSLASVLFSENEELKRANNYIKKSLDDANFYNARLRSIQIAKLYPLIENAYQLEREQQQRKLRVLLWVISALSVLLILTTVYIIAQYRKLAKAREQTLAANQKLRENNRALAETNHIKEEYLGRFLSLCSTYIDKMEKHHHTLNVKAKKGSWEELNKILKSSQFLDDELQEFYHNFDTAFLNIFPNFVEQFNALLNDESRILPKRHEKLTTELRIFALIRLGITDSQKIAEFLRYSITTIYNYRSKYRNKSIVSRDEFENEVMKITSY